MLTPQEKLEKEDKRMHMAFVVNTGVGMQVSKIEHSGFTYYSPTPSIPALYLNIAKKSLTALFELLESNYNGTKLSKIFITRPDEYPSCPSLRLPENNTIFFDCIELYFTHVVFSYSALESFTNFVIANKYNELINLNPENKNEYERQSLEKQNQALKDKLKLELPALLEKPQLHKADNKLWNKFDKFENIRHRLIHLKSDYFHNEAKSPLLNDFIKFITIKQSDYTSDVSQIMRYFVSDAHRWLREFPYA